MSKVDNIRLSMLGLPVMETLEDFSKLTHVSIYTIYQLSKNSAEYYRTYEIPKKNGKPRTISQPSKKLKGFQSWILNNILNQLNVSSSCKGFEKNTSIVDNVEPHKLASAILTLDLKDFFPSINNYKVYNVFKSIGYNNFISSILTKLCTHNDGLPQGGPCSPKLANLSTWTLDVRIQGYVGRRGITYTRYADDLTFSGLNPNKIIKIKSTINAIIEDEKFKINPNKTRVAGLGRSRKVTGLIISDDKFGIGKQKYKDLRAKIHHLVHVSEQSNIKLLREVQGWLSYLNSVDKKRHERALAYVRQLKDKHPTMLISQITTPPLIVGVAAKLSP